jgi:RepB DNA-primase from phage plasmid
MGEDSGKPDYAEARAMLDVCASVGARAVALTLTSQSGGKEYFRGNVPLDELGRMLPAMLDEAAQRKRNVIIRPHDAKPDKQREVSFLQLDDLTADRLPEVAFVTFETSPSNYQAWLALPGRLDKEFASRTRKGAGADIGASGATRIPGSINFKPDHAPEKTGRPYYPVVRIKDARPKQTTTAAKLKELGLVAPEEHFAALSPARFEADRLHQWPDYQYNLDRAKPNKAGTGPDLSGVDFVWCMTAATWGFDVTDTAKELLTLSQHAQQQSDPKDYAERTARNAARYVEQRRQQKQHRHG